MESSKPIPKTLDRLFPKLVAYTPSDQEKAVDPLIGLMRVKENTPKYLMRDGQLIGLNLANTELTDAQWQGISQSPDFDPGYLQALNLSGNKLTVLLPSGMTALKRLDLSENQLTNFELLPGMNQLEELVLDDNPLNSPPKEIMEQGGAAVLRFLRRLAAQGEREVYEVKMLIVGEGGTGKTTLWNKLQDMDYPVPQPPEIQPSTVGIDIKEGWEFKHTDRPDMPFLVNLWDFGGQEIQYMTHQFFLTRRSFYVLLADGRREVANFPYWLKIIDLLGCEQEQKTPLPVLVVLNEKGNPIAQMPYDPVKVMTDFPRLDIIKREVDFAKKDERLKGLPLAIQDILCHRIAHLPLRIPTYWDEVRKALYKRREAQNHIDFSTYSDICHEHGIAREDEVQMTDLSQLMHDLGVILHFHEDVSLRDFIVLNPEWAVNAVYEILRHEEVVNNQGRFDKRMLQGIWTNCRFSSAEQKYLLDLMLKDNLEVCFRATEDRKEIYIAPQLLPQLRPNTLKWPVEEVKLRYAYQYPFMPKGIIGRLIVRMHEDLESQEGKKMVWEKGMVLFKDGCRALIQETEEVGTTGLKLIKIEVSGGQKPEDRRYLLRDIRQELDRIHKRSFQSLRYEEKIPCCCDICYNAESPHYYDLSYLEKLRSENIPDVRCQISLRNVLVNALMGEVLTGFEQKGDREPPSSRAPKKIFFSYSKHDREPLEKLFTALATLRRNKRIQPWHDHQVLPGEEWDEKIKKELREAEIIVFLLSSAALNTDYIWDIEIKTAVERHNRGEARVIPLILEHCDWEDTELGKLNALPQKGKPISAYEKKDEAWKDVVNGIKRIL